MLRLDLVNAEFRAVDDGIALDLHVLDDPPVINLLAAANPEPPDDLVIGVVPLGLEHHVGLLADPEADSGIGGLWTVGSGRWGVDGGEWTVDCGEWGEVDCGEWGEVDGGEWTVDCGEWSVGSGVWGVDGGE